MSTEVKLQVEWKVIETVGELYGKYHQLAKIDGKVKEFLSKLDISVDWNPSHDAAGINDDWPIGWGVFVDDNYNFALLVNFEDHIQVVSSSEKGELSKPLQHISKVLTKFSKMIFSQDSALGFLTTSPKNLGTAFDLHARVLTHTNLSEKTEELLLKNYKCQITKKEKWLYDIDLARTLVPHFSENDSINMFLDCIEWALNTHEPQEDENDKAP